MVYLARLGNVEFLQFLPLAGFSVLTVNDAGLVKRKILQRKIHLSGQIGFDIHCENTGKNQQGQKPYQTHCADNLSDTAGNLSRISCFFTVISFFHNITSYSRKRQKGIFILVLVLYHSCQCAEMLYFCLFWGYFSCVRDVLFFS